MVTSATILATALTLSASALADFRIYLGADNVFDGFDVQWGDALWARTGDHDWSCDDLVGASKLMNGYNDVNMVGGWACDGCSAPFEQGTIERLEIEDTDDRPFTNERPGVLTLYKTDSGSYDLVPFDSPGGERGDIIGTCDSIADGQTVTCAQPLGALQGIHVFTCFTRLEIDGA